MPKTFDLYEPFYQPSNRAEPLSGFEQRLILAAFPPGAVITQAAPARDWGFYPLRIRLQLADEEQVVYLRKDWKIGAFTPYEPHFYCFHLHRLV